MSADEEKFDQEEFLSRWSRLKQRAREQSPAKSQAAAPAVDPAAPPPELPPIDKLTIDSDFRGFFHPKVDESLRHAALKKLFSDPHFNVMDGLDVYIDDYSKPNPLPATMLAGLRQAQKILEWAKETKEEMEAKRAETLAENALPSPAEPAVPPAVPVEPASDEQLPDAKRNPEPRDSAERKS